MDWAGALFLLICDDDMWCEENIHLGPNVYLAIAARPELAFAIMVQANASITTHGSFGVWAGILSKGPMVRLLPKMENTTLKREFILDIEGKRPGVQIYWHDSKISEKGIAGADER